MKKRTFKCRHLKHGDEVPTAEPLRYIGSNGYVRLRWKIGPHSYIETYEHRLVAGLDAIHVHHINGVKTDNRPENLERVTTKSHGERHREFDYAAIAARYIAGETTTAIAEDIGLNCGNVWRVLKRCGVNVDPSGVRRRKSVDHAAVRARWLRGLGCRAIAAEIGSSYHVVKRAAKSMGLSRPVGRVPQQVLQDPSFGA